jgi:hypothetical protein
MGFTKHYRAEDGGDSINKRERFNLLALININISDHHLLTRKAY